MASLTAEQIVSAAAAVELSKRRGRGAPQKCECGSRADVDANHPVHRGRGDPASKRARHACLVRVKRHEAQLPVAAQVNVEPLSALESSSHWKDEPLAKFANDLRGCLRAHRYAFRRAMPGSRSRLFAEKLRPVIERMGVPMGELSEINGEVRQRDLDPPSAVEKRNAMLPRGFNWERDWKPEWTAIVNEVLEELDLPFRIVQPRPGKPARYLVAPKALRAAPQHGEQAPHFDSPHTQDRYALILSLSSGHLSTSVPRYRPDEMEPHTAPLQDIGTDGNGNPRLFDPKKQRSMTYLDKLWYHNVRTEPGDIMIIHSSVMHFGSTNDLEDPRIVLFDLISIDSTPQEGEDDQQWFPVSTRSEGAAWRNIDRS
jgi:hypothetical protein